MKLAPKGAQKAAGRTMEVELFFACKPLAIVRPIGEPLGGPPETVCSRVFGGGLCESARLAALVARLKRRRLSQRQTGLRSPMHPDRKRCSFVGALERRPGRGASALATVRPPRAPASSFRAPFGYKLSLDQVALGGAPGLLCTLHSSLPTGAQLAPMRFNQRPPSDHRGRLSGNKCRAEAPRWRPSSRDKSTIQWGGSRDAPRGAGKSQDALR